MLWWLKFHTAVGAEPSACGAGHCAAATVSLAPGQAENPADRTNDKPDQVRNCRAACHGHHLSPHNESMTVDLTVTRRQVEVNGVRMFYRGAGHWALETHLVEIVSLVRSFLDRVRQ